MAPSFSILSSRMTSISIGSLSHDVGQQAQMAGALDRLGELALLLGRDGGNSARDDLAALRDEALEQPDVLIVDAGRVLAGEGAGFAAAEEWACHRCLSFPLSFGEVAGRAVAPVRTVAPVGTVAARAAVAAVTAVAALAPLVAAHHGGGAGLVLVDPDRHVADDVLVDLGLALQFGDDARGRLEVEHHVMALAVLGDPVGEAAKPPGFGLGDFAA